MAQKKRVSKIGSKTRGAVDTLLLAQLGAEARTERSTRRAAKRKTVAERVFDVYAAAFEKLAE